MKRVFLTLLAMVCLMSFANTALACACCAEAGTYMIRTNKPGEFEFGILDSMKFDPQADLYMTEAAFEMIRGLDDVKKEMESASWNYQTDTLGLVNEFTRKAWKFTIKTPGGKTGTLTLPVPTQVVQFKVDIHDTKDTGLGVQLYKEFRFKGTVQSGTGIFSSGIVKPTTYFLVFQGRGNGCDDVSDYTHWHLEIEGKKASYQFNGKLISSAEQ